MKKKLLIWDFDGVIADTEKLWLTNRQKLLKDYMNIDWDFPTVEKYLKGMSDITKREVLDSLGIGELPDAEKFLDAGSNTLNAVRTSKKLNILFYGGIYYGNVDFKRFSTCWYRSLCSINGY